MAYNYRNNNFTAWTRWNGATSPVASSTATLQRIGGYRRENLTATALFAVALSAYPEPSKLGKPAAKPAAE